MRWSNSRDRSFVSLLEQNSKAKVIDLGCGRGEFTLKVKEKIGCSEVVGVDVYNKALNEARRKKIIVKKVDLNGSLPFEGNSFDVVVSNQVIEHLLYPVKFTEEIHRILKPGGYAIISTENLASWDNVFALLFGYTPFSMEFDSDLAKIGNPLSLHEKEVIKGYPPHVRIFAFKGLVDLTKFVGFKVERVVGSGSIFDKLGELINKKNCRFITIKVRK
jgi:SAM-dependent methyltransferase